VACLWFSPGTPYPNPSNIYMYRQISIGFDDNNYTAYFLIRRFHFDYLLTVGYACQVRWLSIRNKARSANVWLVWTHIHILLCTVKINQSLIDRATVFRKGASSSSSSSKYRIDSKGRVKLSRRGDYNFLIDKLIKKIFT
jgi:hypothetical protein